MIFKAPDFRGFFSFGEGFAKPGILVIPNTFGVGEFKTGAY